MTPRIHPRLPPDQRVPTSHRADMMVYCPLQASMMILAWSRLLNQRSLRH